MCLMRRLYSRAYRVTYSFLTTFGQHFPTIVSDTTSETSDSETWWKPHDFSTFM